jgi:3,4-dihydroxy 2-butanone 4-phosphate synthase/GTP cyclohydrolase II
MKLNTIAEAIEDIKQGKIIIVVDDEDRENEGDFVMSAQLLTPEAVNFMASIGRGLICTPLSADLAERFDLPLQVQTNTANLGTAFTVTIDAKEKISTGISASDRSHTMKLLTNPKTTAADFVRPGHIFPLIAKNHGVLVRNGHTEASVDLCRLSGLAPVAVICEIINPDGSMARLPDLFELAKVHHLKIISIEDLITYRKNTENLISQVETIPFPCKYGDDFKLSIFRSEILGE